MITIPSPLHPALVHFPIVLILIGTVVAIVAVFVRRWHLPWIAAGLLAFGAAGAIAAAWSGGGEKELVGELSATAEQLLDQHEEWGERTRTLAIVAALLALGATTVRRFPAISRTFSVATACAALAASYCVANAGHYGGQLVYKHGAGINTAAGAIADSAVAPAGRANDQRKEADD
jgi:uncharacterized membrane protein